MGKFDGILLVTDFDGTVAVSAKISEGNARAIRYFQQEGGIYTLCSGRPETAVEEFGLPIRLNAPMLAMNGTIIYDTETREYLYRSTCRRPLWEYGESLYSRFSDKVNWVNFYGIEDTYSLQRKREDPPSLLRASYDLPIYKIIVHVTAEYSDEMLAFVTREAEGRFHVSRSWINGIELQGIESSKGLAVLRLREMLGDRVKMTVCAGDYENDIPMLEVADLSYAVGNATPAVKAAADRVTVPCAEDAVAVIIRELETSAAGNLR